MRYHVAITPQAESDLKGIYQFILDREGPLTAQGVYQDLKKAILGLAVAPFRGKEPVELEPFGSTDYLQIVVKPYRILYYVQKSEVQIVLIADGRRDFSSLLAQRLRQ